jgi:hypothetical protein
MDCALTAHSCWIPGTVSGGSRTCLVRIHLSTGRETLGLRVGAEVARLLGTDAGIRRKRNLVPRGILEGSGGRGRFLPPIFRRMRPFRKNLRVSLNSMSPGGQLAGARTHFCETRMREIPNWHEFRVI